MDIAVFVNDDVEHANKSPDAFSGSRLWSLMFFAGLIGKFFGLLSGAIFLGF